MKRFLFFIAALLSRSTGNSVSNINNASSDSDCPVGNAVSTNIKYSKIKPLFFTEITEKNVQLPKIKLLLTNI